MMKKILSAIVGLGLIAGASAPAMAQHYQYRDRGSLVIRGGDRDTGITLRLGTNNGRQYYYADRSEWRDWRGDRYRHARHYRYVPRCYGDDIAVRSPYHYGRYVCIDRDDLRHPRFR